MNKKQIIEELELLYKSQNQNQQVLSILIDKLRALPDENKFDPDKEYTFQEAAELAFENPGWVFNLGEVMTDKSNQLMFKPELDAYFVNGYAERFKLSLQDVTEKWRRVK